MSESLPLDIRNLSHSYDDTPTFNQLNLSIRSGELLALLGPSGCGKSSLLRSIAGFITPQSGTIQIGSQQVTGNGSSQVPPQQRQVGMVFQDYALFPGMDVNQNIGFGIADNPKAQERIQALLSLFDLSELGNRKPGELSGGQQQRVALARALAPKPQFLLLDEPFANLDASLRARVGHEVRAALAKENTAALLVTHDREEALGLADRVAILAAPSPGETPTIVQMGTPQEIYNMPKSTTVAKLSGPCTLVEVKCQNETATTELGSIPLTVTHNGSGTLVIRPEHIRIEEGESNAQVIDAAYRGALTECYVRTALGVLHLFADSNHAPTPESSCRVSIAGPCCIIPD